MKKLMILGSAIEVLMLVLASSLLFMILGVVLYVAFSDGDAGKWHLEGFELYSPINEGTAYESAFEKTIPVPAFNRLLKHTVYKTQEECLTDGGLQAQDLKAMLVRASKRNGRDVTWYAYPICTRIGGGEEEWT